MATTGAPPRSDRDVTAAIEAAILKLYAPPEYATFLQVADGTGARQSRWADAVALSCWPSRGYGLHGFEIKASRNDWLREKKAPEKSTAVQRFCSGWSIVTIPGVVQPLELPERWGLIELHGRRLETVVKAPPLQPEPMTLPFIASLLRNSAKSNARVVEQMIEERTRAVRDEAEERIKTEVARRTERVSSLESVVSDFKRVTGVALNEPFWYKGKPEVYAGFADYMKLREQTAELDRLAYAGRLLREVTQSVDALQQALRAAVAGADSAPSAGPGKPTDEPQTGENNA